MLPLIDSIVNGVSTVLDKWIPDANVREQVKLAVAEEAINWAKMDAGDRESARRREVETKDTTTRELAYIYTFGYFACLGALLGGWVQVPSSMDGLVDVLMGVLTAGQYSIMAYYFGSSHGSSIKDQYLVRKVRDN